MKNLILSLLLVLPALLPAQSTSKTDSLLKQTSFDFKKASENVWMTTVEGKHRKEISLILVESDGMTIVFSIVKEKAADAITAAQLKSILKLTMAIDRIKIGLDDDDSLVVRIDGSTRLIDLEELNLMLDQAGAAADETYAVLQIK